MKQLIILQQKWKPIGNYPGMIFDLTVPGALCGKEAIACIRKLDANVPVFVASGYDNPVIKDPFEYGFTASICKPFLRSELVIMLQKYLKQNNF